MTGLLARSTSLGLALLVCTFSAAAAQEKKKFTEPRVMPGGGVADPVEKIGFFPNVAGGIDALVLASGNLVWSTKEANIPLLATENRLFAQSPVPNKANQVRVVGLDTKDGKRVLESKPIVFPEWVVVGVAHGRSYRSSVRLDPNGLYLSWLANAWYAGGARPTREREEAERKEASGVVRIDLDAGKTEPLVKAVAFFLLPKEIATVKLGDRMLSVKDTSANNPREPDQVRRSLHATDANGKMLWERPIAAPVYLRLRK